MRWLVLTNNDKLLNSINESLLSADKKNKITSSSLESSNLNKEKKNFKELAGIFIYLKDEDKLSEENKNLLSSLMGFFAFDKIPIYTDSKILQSINLFSKDTINEVKSEDIADFISKKYKKMEEKSIERLSKNALLNRGIPFTSDCFATYIAKDKIEIVNEFLAAGMSVNSRDDMGVPMLNIACRNDNFEFTKMILELGADLNAVSNDRGYTAVMDAVWRGNEKITKYLIDKGADLNTINKEGQTNLILAVGANRENIVKLLAENGSDPDVKDMMGMSAYTYASLFKKTRIVEILKPFHKEG
ncbi:MAG: ankyrin repeat domain-containing protein [Treponema sp.]|nr:ankyrin repeat domain-containing protein [Treponema sp.]